MILINVILSFLIVLNLLSAIFQLCMGNYNISAVNLIAVIVFIIAFYTLNRGKSK